MARKSKKATETSVDGGAPSIATPTRGFLAEQSILKAIAKRLASVADRKSTMPMLARALVSSSTSGTTFAVTDLDQYLTILVPHYRASDYQEFTVDAKLLSDVIATCPKGSIDVTKHRDDSFATLNLVNLQSSRTLDCQGYYARDFPKIPSAKPEATWHAIDGRAFASMLERVKFSVCKDETRFHLAGVYVECNGDPMGSDGALVKTTTTDGHRLTKAETRIPGFPAIPKGRIVRGKAISEIVRMCGKLASGDTCEISIDPKYTFVRVTRTDGTVETLATSLIDAQFPAYEQVIPSAPGKLATVDRKMLLATIERAKVLSCETRGTLLTIGDGKLVVRADHPDKGSLVESLAGEGQAVESDKTFKIGTNPAYLIGILEEITDDRVTLSFTGELDPILVRGVTDAYTTEILRSSLLGVVMPMRI